MPADRPSDATCRSAIVAAGRRLGARGLIFAGEGNLSLRLGDALLITPTGLRKDELEPDDLIVVPLAAEDAAGASSRRASSDLAIHRAVYAARTDVVAVVHAHLPAAMALTLAGEVPDPAVLPETALLLPRVPFVPFADAGSDELAAAIALALTQPPVPLADVALLERHGAVAVGSREQASAESEGAALDQAVNRLELLEVLCRTWRDALLIRAAVPGRGGRTMLRPPSPAPGRRREGDRGRQP
ncbi:MAG TPA: class II aldolase/adducin family protein [Solirubrobacterales bacterium]|nr:class II aldolase/adducin family protein [Solirubrobacterales bacterium]